MTRYHPVPLYIKNLAQGTIGLYVSKQITSATILAEILMCFPTGTNLALLYQFFYTTQIPGSLTAIPGSGEITANEASPGYFADDGKDIRITFQWPIPGPGYLVLVSTNNGTVTYNCAAIATIGAPN